MATTPAPLPSGPPYSKAQTQQLDATLLALISGQVKRGDMTASDWDALLAFSAAKTGLQADVGTTQPLSLFQEALNAQGLSKQFQSAFQKGVSANVWVKDANSQFGYIYNTAFSGQPATPGGLSNQQLLSDLQGLVGGSTTATPNMLAEIQNIAVGWGLNYTSQQVQQMIKSMNGATDVRAMYNAIEQTPQFHEAFPGIFNSNGTLKMSPTQYITTKKSYEAYATKNGVMMDPKRLTWLFQNNVSPTEFAQRSQAVQTLRDNQQYFNAFNQQLKQQGMQPLTEADKFKMIMGEGNAEWYDTWNNASSRYAGEQAGLKFGPSATGTGANYLRLGEGVVKQVAGLGLTAGQTSSGYAQLAKDLTSLLPQSRIQGMGLTKKDLVQLEFGGPNQAAIAVKAAQIVANEKAAVNPSNKFLGLDLNPGLIQSGELKNQSTQPFAQTPG